MPKDDLNLKRKQFDLIITNNAAVVYADMPFLF